MFQGFMLFCKLHELLLKIHLWSKRSSLFGLLEYWSTGCVLLYLNWWVPWVRQWFACKEGSRESSTSVRIHRNSVDCNSSQLMGVEGFTVTHEVDTIDPFDNNTALLRGSCNGLFKVFQKTVSILSYFKFPAFWKWRCCSHNCRMSSDH